MIYNNRVTGVFKEGIMMKFHSIKTKMLSVYAILIVFTVGTSLSFIISLISLEKNINWFMQANYKSIIAGQDMTEALDESQAAILEYILGDEPASIQQFMVSNNSFTQAFLVANGNITEKGESETVGKLNSSYQEYYKSFFELQGYKKSHNTGETLDYYNSNIMNKYSLVKENCKLLVTINESAMLRSKSRTTANANMAVYINTAVSFAAMLLSLAIAYYVLSNIFKPINQLTNSVRSIREGNLCNDIQVNSDDEIGELAHEFNSLTKRLQEYDRMNIKKLVDEKNKSVSIVNSISDPIIVTDVDHRIILLNPACELVFDITQDDALGKHFLEAIENKSIYSIMNDAAKDSSKYDGNPTDIITLNVKDKDMYYRVTAAPIYGKDNDVIGTVAVLQDITHLKEVENLKSEFVSTVSHEFRTPLTSISLGVGLLLDGTLGEINEGQREIITAIMDEETRLANLVNDLLDLSRIESGKIAINMKLCKIENIIGDTVGALMEQAKNKGINLGYYFDEELPPVKADSDKIRIVLTNLIGNALKFTPQNGKIEVFAYLRGRFVYVSVKDNGIGIPREYHERIFERFVQVKKDINDGVGSGLGLAIAKKIVELHGGDIWVESKEGDGSTFTFTLKTASKE